MKDDTVITDDQELAEVLNDHYISIGRDAGEGGGGGSTSPVAFL